MYQNSAYYNYKQYNNIILLMRLLGKLKYQKWWSETPNTKSYYC